MCSSQSIKLLKALRLQILPRQQRNAHRTHKHARARQIQHRVDARIQQMRRYQRTDDAEQSSPKARQPRRRATNRRRERLGRPPVQHGVEHALEEVFHAVDADVGSLGVDLGEDEQARAHHGAGEYHGELPAVVEGGAEGDAGDAKEVDVNVGAVS